MHAKVLALVGEQDGCFLWRIALPFTELQRQGYRGIEWGMREDNRLAQIVHQFDAVILPRLHWPIEERAKADQWFKALHRAGLAVIYEVDDDLFSEDFVRRLVVQHGKSPAEAKERQSCILHALRSCDGVTVSGQRLATMVREYTDQPVKVVPNFIDLTWFHKVQKAAQRQVPGLTIGWAGGNRPDADVEIMARAWARIAKRYPQVTFVIQGHHAKVLYDLVPNERIAMLDWMPIDQYPAGLVNIDIGCCPLGDTKFNRAKTYIKAMEYAASGAAVVASPTVYSQLIDPTVNGYLATSVDEWEGYLSLLVESYTLRRDLSKRLLAKVRREHSLTRQAWRWVEAWDEITAHYRGDAPGSIPNQEAAYGTQNRQFQHAV
jgi:glycosyltransferase involved in cell wall biosynthesis